MPRYKWSHASDWLEQKIDDLANAGDEAVSRAEERDLGRALSELRQLAHDLASKLDGDTIQDLFQSDMDADGFFLDLDKAEAQAEEEDAKARVAS